MTYSAKRFDVFVSYAKEDVASAQRIAHELQRAGFTVWFDLEQLLPGQAWRVEIESAIPRCLTFVALVSARSVTKVGFVQRELKIALEVIDTVPQEVPFVIPVRLDESIPTHSRLRDIQWLDLFDDWEKGIAKLVGSIRLARELRGVGNGPDEFLAFLTIRLNVIDNALSVIQALRSRPEIRQVWFCEGEDDLIALIDTTDLDSLLSINNWVRALPRVTNTHMRMILSAGL